LQDYRVPLPAFERASSQANYADAAEHAHQKLQMRCLCSDETRDERVDERAQFENARKKRLAPELVPQD
jgi:hypothetical protein